MIICNRRYLMDVTFENGVLRLEAESVRDQRVIENFMSLPKESCPADNLATRNYYRKIQLIVMPQSQPAFLELKSVD